MKQHPRQFSGLYRGSPLVESFDVPPRISPAVLRLVQIMLAGLLGFVLGVLAAHAF